jgi:hypothetical protein
MQTRTDDWALGKPGGHALQGRIGQGPGGVLSIRVELVQVPAQRLIVLIVSVRSATRWTRWSSSSLTSHQAWSWPAVGSDRQVGFADRGPRDRQRVDRVGSAQGPNGCAAISCGGTRPRVRGPAGLGRAGGDVPAVLTAHTAHRASSGMSSPAAAHDLAHARPRWSGRAGGLPGRPPRRVWWLCAVLVRTNAQQHHAGVFLFGGDAKEEPAGMPGLGPMPRSSQATPGGPRHGRGSTT